MRFQRLNYFVALLRGKRGILTITQDTNDESIEIPYKKIINEKINPSPSGSIRELSSGGGRGRGGGKGLGGGGCRQGEEEEEVNNRGCRERSFPHF